MITPSDKDYISTKKIKQRTFQIKKELIPLAKWIDQYYDVNTLNIILDTIGTDKPQPRLQICLEYAKDKDKFMDRGTGNYDKIKQNKIAEKYLDITADYGKRNKFGWLNTLAGKPEMSKMVFVCFTDFESVAKIEANQRIPENKIEQLKSEINNPELWRISRIFYGVTFFLHTDEQVKKYQGSEIHENWKKQYYNLLKQYDEFRYFNKNTINFYLDSKENFDTNYQSNWYYYYK